MESQPNQVIAALLTAAVEQKWDIFHQIVDNTDPHEVLVRMTAVACAAVISFGKLIDDEDYLWKHIEVIAKANHLP